MLSDLTENEVEQLLVAEKISSVHMALRGNNEKPFQVSAC